MPPPIKFPPSAPSAATPPSSTFQPPPMKKAPPQIFTPSGVPSAPANNKDQQQPQHKLAPPPPPGSSIPPRYQIQPSLSSNPTPEVSPIKNTNTTNSTLPNQNNFQNRQDQQQSKLPDNQPQPQQQQIKTPLPNPPPPSKQAPPLPPPPGSASSSTNNSRNATPTNNNSRRPPPPALPPSRSRSNPNSAENSRNNSPKNEKKEIAVDHNESSTSFTVPKKMMMMPPPPKSREGSRNPTPTNINTSRSGSQNLDTNPNINTDGNKKVVIAPPTPPVVAQIKLQPDQQKNPTPTAHQYDRSEEIEEIDREDDRKVNQRENVIRDQKIVSQPPQTAAPPPPSAMPQLQLLQIQKVENPFIQQGQGQNEESTKNQPNRLPPPPPPSAPTQPQQQQQQQQFREIIPTPTNHEQQQQQSRQEKPIQRPDALPSSDYNGMTSAAPPSSAKLDDNKNTKNNFGPSLQDPSQKQSEKNNALPLRKSVSNPGSRTQSPDPYSNSDNRNNNNNQINNNNNNGSGVISAARIPRDTNTAQQQQQQQQQHHQRTTSAPSSSRVISKTPMITADFSGVAAASSRGNSAVAIPNGFSSGPSSAHGCVNPPVRRATVTTVAIQTEFSWDQLMEKMKREIVDEVRRQNSSGGGGFSNPSVYVVSSREVGEQLTRLLAKDPKSIERNRKPERNSSTDDASVDEVEYHQNLFSGNLLKMVQKNNISDSVNATILLDSPRNSRNFPNSRNQDFVTSFNSTYDMLPSVVAAATDRTVLRPVETSRRFNTTPTGTPVRGASTISNNNNNATTSTTMPQKPGVIFSSSKTFVAEKEDLMMMGAVVNQSESNKMADKVHRGITIPSWQNNSMNNNNSNMFLSQIFHQQNNSQNSFDDRYAPSNSERRARNLAIHEREKDQRVNPFLPTSESSMKHHHAVTSGPFVGSHNNLVEDTKQRARDPLHSVVALEEI